VTPHDKSVDAQGDSYDPQNAYIVNYWALYFNWLSVIVHLLVMSFGMQWWCNYSKIAMIYTAQFLVLHSLCWAIPDRRYFSFAISNLYLFVMLAVVNVAGYFAMGVWGVHSYLRS
jgi:hypothetical protein